MKRKLDLLLMINIVSIACTSFAPVFAGPADAHKSWSDLENQGSYALDSNQYWQAEPLLKQALDQAKAFGDSDLRYAKSLGELGRLYTVRGRFAEAEPYLEQEYAVKERALGKADGQLIPAMASLIKFHVNYGSASKARALTQELLSFVEGKVMELVAPTESSTKFKKGMALEGYAGAADSSLHPTMDWALACDEVANAFRERRDFSTADRLYKAALDVKASIVGKEHLALGLSYDYVGSLYMERGDTREAASYFKDALAVTQRTLSSDNPEVFSRLDKYAKALIKEGKYAQAEQLYLHAQRFWKPEPERDGDRARAAFALGCLYCDQKKFAQAEPMLRHAAHLAETYHGPRSANLVPYLDKYAYALYYLGRRGEQERLKVRVASISGGM